MERAEGTGTTVRERILATATAEFLDRGFTDASLRHIAAGAGVTTGAIYGYFASKGDLFDAIVRGPADELYARYEAAQAAFYDMPADAQSLEVAARSERDLVHELYDFIFDNREAFLLLLTKSAGTSWEHFVDRYVDVELRSTERYVREMGQRGMTVNELDLALSRTLAELFFRAFFRPLELGLSREETHAFVASCSRFFHAGYRALMDPAAGE